MAISIIRDRINGLIDIIINKDKDLPKLNLVSITDYSFTTNDDDLNIIVYKSQTDNKYTLYINDSIKIQYLSYDELDYFLPRLVQLVREYDLLSLKEQQT